MASSPTHFATTTSSHDHQLLMWDLKRPALPFRTFRGHSGHISGWRVSSLPARSPNSADMAFPRFAECKKFLTCGRDSKLIMHFWEHGDATMDSFLPVSMACSSRSELLVACEGDRLVCTCNAIAAICTDPTEYERGDLLAEHNFARPLQSTLRRFDERQMPSIGDAESLIKLAKRWALERFHFVRSLARLLACSTPRAPSSAIVSPATRRFSCAFGIRMSQSSFTIIRSPIRGAQSQRC